MRLTILVVMFLSCSFICFGQEVTVKDQVTHQPLQLVTLYNLNHKVSAVTDAQGQADISNFKHLDSIHFRLIGYGEKIYSYEEINEKSFDIYLEPTQMSLDELVISANRWQQTTRDVPGKISTIQPGDVALQNPQTTADLLAISGQVYIQKSQLGGGSPMIRGFATNRVLLVVDGVRMNNAIFRSGNVQNVISLNPFTIQRTEVLFGPGSVMYGSDAIGGVMGFQTLQPQFSQNDKMLVTGKGVTRYATANNEKTGHIDVNFGLNRWTFLTSVSFSDFDDLRMGSHGPEEYLRSEYAARINGKDTILNNPDPRVQTPSGYSQYYFMQKIRFRPNDRWDYDYGFHYSATSDFPRYDRLIRYRNGSLRSAEWYYGPQKWMMNNLNISHNLKTGVYDQMNLTMAQQYFGESRHDRDFNSSVRSDRTEQVYAYSVNLDLEKNFDEKHILLYGFEVLHNDIFSTGVDTNIETGFQEPAPSRYPDGANWTSYGAYASYRLKPNDLWTLQGGGRYSYVNLNALIDTSFFPFPFTKADLNAGALTGSLGAVYHPGENFQLRANISTGFRAPNVDDVGKVFDSEPGAVVVPNPNLKPEYAYNAEMGLAKVFGNRVKVDFTAYYTILDNALVRRDFILNDRDSIEYEGQLSKVQAIQNAANARVYGVQAGLEVKLPAGFGISSQFTYQIGEEELDIGETAPLRHAPPWYGATHITYKRARLKVDFYAVYNGEMASEDLAPSEQSKVFIYAHDENGNLYSPAWHTFNLKAMYQVTDYFSINAGVENLTDQRYRPYSSGLAAPGRNVIISLKATF